MSVGFGFSAGDFVAALKLVKTVVDALGGAKGASAEYRKLLDELLALEAALQQVERIELEDSQVG